MYENVVCEDVVEGRNNSIKNKLYGLLREFEKKREWEKFLDTIIVEVLDFSEEEKSIYYLNLIEKLAKLRYLRYEYFRSTIFDCMSLMERL